MTKERIVDPMAFHGKDHVTLAQVLIDLIMAGADRGALVREEGVVEGKCAAVCVIMLSDEAIRDLGVHCARVAACLEPNPKQDFKQPISEQINMGDLFGFGDKSPSGWCYAAFTFGATEVLLSIFTKAVDRVVEFCNANHAPCTLNPKIPPPGCKFLQHKER